MTRWMSLLGQFHFRIEHIPGSKHLNADGVSQCYDSAKLGCCGGRGVFPPPDPEIQPFGKSVAGSSLDGDLLPLQSGELYVASLMMEDVVLFEG